MRDQFILYWELQPENRAVSYLHTEPYEEDLAGGATLRELKSSKGGDRRNTLEESAVTRVLPVLVCQDVGHGVRCLITLTWERIGCLRTKPEHLSVTVGKLGWS